LKATLGLLVGLGTAVRVAAQQAEASRGARPQPGDQLVFSDGDRRGEIIAQGNLTVAGPRVMAYPLDPKTKTVRDGSRLNQVLVVRFEAAELGDESRHRSAEGIVAYSAVCTHQGCDVMAWLEERRLFWCPCHDSKFDPRDGARVVEGPAPKRLAALPLKLLDGVVTVAGGFAGKVGAQVQ
jgi:Rieske Fe-S protein